MCLRYFEVPKNTGWHWCGFRGQQEEEHLVGWCYSSGKGWSPIYFFETIKGWFTAGVPVHLILLFLGCLLASWRHKLLESVCKVNFLHILTWHSVMNAKERLRRMSEKGFFFFLSFFAIQPYKIKCMTKVYFFKREGPCGTFLFCPRGVHLVHLVLPGTREAVSCHVKTQKRGGRILSFFFFPSFFISSRALNVVAFSSGVVFYEDVNISNTLNNQSGQELQVNDALIRHRCAYFHVNIFLWSSLFHTNVPSDWLRRLAELTRCPSTRLDQGMWNATSLMGKRGSPTCEGRRVSVALANPYIRWQ